MLKKSLLASGLAAQYLTESMKPLNEQLAELKAAYTRRRLDCADNLLPPAGEDEIQRLGVILNMSIPAELCSLLRIHGGQIYAPPGTSGIFGRHRLHAPGEIVEQYQMYQFNCNLWPPPEFPPNASEWGYWVPSLIPFASWDEFDLCIDSNRCDVWEFCPSIGLTSHLPSISSVLSTLLSAVNTMQELTLPTRSIKEE